MTTLPAPTTLAPTSEVLLEKRRELESPKVEETKSKDGPRTFAATLNAASIPFYAVHLIAAFGIWKLGFSWSGVALAVGLYYVRMFGVTGGYHRYFSHATFKTGRVFQFILAVLAMTSSQKGVLWWAAHHRVHHKESDKPTDVHSKKQDGFFWSHVGWILSRRYDDTLYSEIPDFAKYPELVFINRHWYIVPATFGVGLFLAGGWFALVWGFFVSTALLWHGTFSINSVAHWFGRRRYQTTDESKNSFSLALVTLGEGWHNNHHYFPKSCSQGFYWWEIDVTYYVIRALALVGIVWDIKEVPAKIRDRRMERKRAA